MCLHDSLKKVSTISSFVQSSSLSVLRHRQHSSQDSVFHLTTSLSSGYKVICWCDEWCDLEWWIQFTIPNRITLNLIRPRELYTLRQYGHLFLLSTCSLCSHVIVSTSHVISCPLSEKNLLCQQNISPTRAGTTQHQPTWGNNVLYVALAYTDAPGAHMTALSQQWVIK